MSPLRRICLAALVAVLGGPLATPDGAAQNIHRWVDKDGKVHYSNVAPSATPAEGEAERSAPPPEVDVVREAPEADDESASEPAPPVAARPTEKPGPYASLGEDQFSTRVTERRTRLKREITDARRRIAEIDGELARMREARDPALEQARNLAGVKPPEQLADEALKKDREKAEKRIEEANKEYAELRAEAVKRFGREPAWWLSLD